MKQLQTADIFVINELASVSVVLLYYLYCTTLWIYTIVCNWVQAGLIFAKNNIGKIQVDNHFDTSIPLSGGLRTPWKLSQLFFSFEGFPQSL